MALITSDERTNGLSRLVATLGLSSRLHRAYVGLTDIDQEGKFTSVLGIILQNDFYNHGTVLNLHKSVMFLPLSFFLLYKLSSFSNPCGL